MRIGVVVEEIVAHGISDLLRHLRSTRSIEVRYRQAIVGARKRGETLPQLIEIHGWQSVAESGRLARTRRALNGDRAGCLITAAGTASLHYAGFCARMN